MNFLPSSKQKELIEKLREEGFSIEEAKFIIDGYCKFVELEKKDRRLKLEKQINKAA